MCKESTTKKRTEKAACNKYFLTITETAEQTGLSTYYLRQGIREGWIPFIRCGAKAMINFPKLIAILDEESEQQEGSEAV